MLFMFNLFYPVLHVIETNHLICTANQVTGFYNATPDRKGLELRQVPILSEEKKLS